MGFGDVPKTWLSLSAQLRSWKAAVMCGLCHANDVGLLGRPSPTTLLSSLQCGMEEIGKQTRVLGQFAVPLSALYLSFHAASL